MLSSFPEHGVALVQGASRGIGLGLVRALLASGRFARVIATCRDPASADRLQAVDDARLTIRRLDVVCLDQFDALAAELERSQLRPQLIVNAAGILHDDGLAPEKRIEDLDAAALQRVFAVNAFAPVLLLQALRPLLPREGKVVFAAISARVGSIGDNRLGGWYAYRASKAALNQFIRTAAIELKRRNRNAIVAALHPGTTDTALSKPFQARVPADRLFSVEQTAGYLLDVIDGLDESDSGGFFAWDGTAIEW